MSGAIAPLMVFALAFGAVLWFAGRNPLLRTLAFREAFRRRGQTALVVGGLMVGTATIAAALVGGDSVEQSTVDAFAYRNWGFTDLTVTGDNAFFDASVAQRVAADPALKRFVDGVAGGIDLPGSASNLTRKLGTSGVALVGIDPTAQKPFGAFALTSGESTLMTDLDVNQVLVSRQLAEAIDARAGDKLRVASAVGGGKGKQSDLIVAGVAKAEGPGAYTLGPAVFARVETLRRVLGVTGINIVRVSATGGIRDADDAAALALPRLRRAIAPIPEPPKLTAVASKIREAELARESTIFIRSMLLGMSAIVVAAGAALMVNITGMLAEERRTRLGVLRALGLRRRRIVGLSVIEGAMYAVAAGVAGAFIGIFAGRIISERFGRAFAEFAGEDVDFQFRFSLRPTTLAIAFAIGSLLTLGVIFFASRRTSRMTITAAIRNLPEPERESRRSRRAKIVRRTAGVLLGAGGIALGEPMTILLGAIFLILVASSILRPRMSNRVHATVTGLALAGTSMAMIAGQSPEADAGAFFSLFVVVLLTSVFGLTIAVTANLHAVDTAIAVFGRFFVGLRAVLRPPLAYLSRRPTRTGLTTGVFALVIAMLTLFAIFLVVFKPSYDNFGNGFDVRVLSTGSSNVTLPKELPGTAQRTLVLPTRGYIGPFRSPGAFGNSERIFVPLYRTPDDAPKNGPLKLEQRAEKYRSDADAWAAVLRDPKLVITNFAAVGTKMTLRNSGGSQVAFTVVGAQPFVLEGVFMGPKALEQFFTAPLGAAALVDLKDPGGATEAARTIERTQFAQGLEAETVQELLDRSARAFRAIFSTITVLMQMGLVVGIMSLGIVALRLVTERRHVIGVMRALGYKRRQVMAGLLAEAAVTATIGVIVGGIVGVLMGWMFNRQQEVPTPFGIDGGSVAGVLAIVYLATMLVTLGPAWRASRLPPAEAVRYSE